jgi:UDP-N-acetylmuramoylalanine--D-glutamate ligase
VNKYQNKKIAIYGMGVTGYSAAKALKKLNGKIICWDDSLKIRNNLKKLKISVSKFWQRKEKVDFIVISPGIDINNCKIKKYLSKNLKIIITDIDIFFELNKNNIIISVTGTNGKSTTCKIIEKILKTANYNVKTVGNIGTPVLTARAENEKQIFILEVSSYQLQYSKQFKSNHAAILNISPDHLERHKNINNYIKIKSKIFFSQKKGDYSYINLENRYSQFIKSIIKRNKIKSRLFLIKKSYCNKILKKIDSTYFKSKGNIENLCFAYTIAKNLKISDNIIIKAINNFKGLAHRQEIIFSNKKVLCVNDSKATSFDASLQSLLNFKNIYWVLGGIPKYKDSFNFVGVKKNIVKAYIIGKNISFFEKKIKNNINYNISNTLQNAIKNILKDLKNVKSSQATILISPAAASFDQFDNFENRGNIFKKIIFKKFKKK